MYCTPMKQIFSYNYRCYEINGTVNGKNLLMTKGDRNTPLYTILV